MHFIDIPIKRTIYHQENPLYYLLDIYLKIMEKENHLSENQIAMIELLVNEKPKYVTQIYLSNKVCNQLCELLEKKHIPKARWIISLLILYFFHADFQEFIDRLRTENIQGDPDINKLVAESKKGSECRIQIRTHDELFTEVMIMAKKRNLSVSEIIRFMIINYIYDSDFKDFVDQHYTLKEQVSELGADIQNGWISIYNQLEVPNK